MFTYGPINMRPLLNQEWYKKGGATNVCLSIGLSWPYVLPFMPLGSASQLASGDTLPTIDQLLSRKRFFLRGHMLKTQAKRFMKDPLFFELAHAQTSAGTKAQRQKTLEWRQHGNIGITPDRLLSVIDQGKGGLVITHGGASIGDVWNSLFSGIHSERLLIRWAHLVPFPIPFPTASRSFSASVIHLHGCALDPLSFTLEPKPGANS